MYTSELTDKQRRLEVMINLSAVDEQRRTPTFSTGAAPAQGRQDPQEAGRNGLRLASVHPHPALPLTGGERDGEGRGLGARPRRVDNGAQVRAGPDVAEIIGFLYFLAFASV